MDQETKKIKRQTIPARKKVRFVPTSATQDRVRRIKKNICENEKIKQSGKGLASDLAKIGLTMGSKAVNSSLGQKLINKVEDNIPNIFKYGVSKIKNKKY